MAGRTLFCRWPDCTEAYISIAGQWPDRCPACNRLSRWTTIAPYSEIPPYPDPVKPWELTDADVRFLRTNRIDPEAHGEAR